MSNSASKQQALAHKAKDRLAAAADEDEADDPDEGAQAPPGAVAIEEDLRDEEAPDMDPDEADPEADVEVDEDDEAFTLDDVIERFLIANSSPTDEQVHAFAALVGLEYPDFEALIFKKFGAVVRQGMSLGPTEDEYDFEEDDQGGGPDLDDPEDDDDLELEADEDLDVQDDVDMFICAYMLFNATPSDEQIHNLAFVVDITKEQMEQRIYRMLGSFLSVGGDEEGEDEDDDGEEEDDEDQDQDGDQDDDEGDEDDLDDDATDDKGETE